MAAGSSVVNIPAGGSVVNMAAGGSCLILSTPFTMDAFIVFVGESENLRFFVGWLLMFVKLHIRKCCKTSFKQTVNSYSNA